MGYLRLLGDAWLLSKEFCVKYLAIVIALLLLMGCATKKTDTPAPTISSPNSDAEKSNYYVGMAYSLEGNPSLAQINKYINKAISYNPLNDNAYIAKAEFTLDLQEAIENYKIAISLKPDNPEYHYVRLGINGKNRF